MGWGCCLVLIVYALLVVALGFIAAVAVATHLYRHKQLAQHAFRDSLTGLYNRAFFEQELPRLDQPKHWPLSVLVGDLNGLKLTNDIFGHLVGDELLIAVSQAFREVCRPEDRVFRWGGDEFIVLLPATGQEAADEIRQRLQQALVGRAISSIPVNLPLGCRTKVDGNQDIQTVWQQAEEDMYWMKTIGQTRFERETLNGIMQELHGRSSAEREHAHRVSRLAEEFGRYLALDSDELRSLRLCGLLHDIGKVALEPMLLEQPYPLKPEDEREMKRHPLVGFRLLNLLDETADLATAVLAHHEHWDGGGYPRGLKEDEIPYFGRILAVVETYDRVHERSRDQALELIREGAGKKFDPALCSAFLEMMAKSA
jgi:diguanylate cyclase (GGDEF)-like protein